MRHSKDIGPLTIESGQTSSATSIGYEILRQYDELIIYAPATLAETVNPQVSYDGTNFRVLRSGGSSVAVAANGADVVLMSAFKALRLTATGAVAAQRAFQVHGIVIT